ncbi:MAG: hypothetical protein IJH63_00835 [Methanobrevibacter sp.]|nr:hypothetical protein [Methanosphaera sp.]MBR0369250.1 hypothetical protein [Methanobrevibacter sp.]
MTIKQCNSCKYHTYEKRQKHNHEGCSHPFGYTYFMSSKNCHGYQQGEINTGKKELYERLGREAPYKFLKD